MLTLPPGRRVFAATGAVDFCKGFDGLVALVRSQIGRDPLTGDLFCFFNRRRDRVKILVWDRNGFWLHYKRLERGTFERLDGATGTRELDRARMAMLLDGIDTRNSKAWKHYVPEVRIECRDESVGARAS